MLLKFAVKEFLDDRAFRNVSTKTLENYKGTLLEFHAYCVANQVVNDVDFVNQVVTVMGKKRQQSSIPMTPKLRRELSEYRIFAEQQLGELPEYVFTDRAFPLQARMPSQHREF